MRNRLCCISETADLVSRCAECALSAEDRESISGSWEFFEGNREFFGSYQARNRAERRRLAGIVRTEQRDDLPAACRERHLPQSLHTPYEALMLAHQLFLSCSVEDRAMR